MYSPQYSRLTNNFVSPPKKQGILYTLQTGKDNGPYLSRDIAMDNNRSLKLLGRQSRDAHRSFVNTIRLAQKQSSNQTNKLGSLLQVQNFSKNYEFDIKQMQKMKQTANYCTQAGRNLRAQLRYLNDQHNKNLAQLTQNAFPALKTLKQKVKSVRSQQTALYTKIRGQLQKIQNSFDHMQGIIKQCQMKISSCQDKYHGTIFNL